jgi:hypothetical protein
MANQPHVSAAADDAKPVAGEYYTGLRNHHDLGTCEVWLASAPESVLDRLHAMHPGVYVIHNDAPRSLQEIEEIIERIDMAALQDAGISIHGKGPTQDGYVQVAVERDAPGAQAKFDEMFGPGVVRGSEEPVGRTTPLRVPVRRP